jgi:hypothetical protein
MTSRSECIKNPGRREDLAEHNVLGILDTRLR